MGFRDDEEEWKPSVKYEPGFTEKNKYQRVVLKLEFDNNYYLVPIELSEIFDNMLDDAFEMDNYDKFDENFKSMLINDNMEIYLKR